MANNETPTESELNLWNEISLQDGKVHYTKAGNLHLWIKFQDEEIWIAHGFTDEFNQEVTENAPPSDLSWARWANKIASGNIKLQPVFPDIPLVVNSEYVFKISPGTDIKIYTRIPIWVRISLAKNNYKLIELPTVKLSKTWFGTPTEGDLCYYATTTARRDLSKVVKKTYLVACPILISNKSEAELNFEHFCLRGEWLSIYLHEGELWADETRILYQGEDLKSDVILTWRLQQGVKKEELLTRPRTKINQSLATRTFKHFFEDILNFGH